MTNNYVQSIYDNSKKIYKQVTSKNFLKWFYVAMFSGLFVFGAFIIIGLSIPIQPNGTILLLTGVCIAPVILIAFYVVEYMRRKALNYYKNEFNFSSLYGNYLHELKLIDVPSQLDSDFDNSFFRQQLEILTRRYQFANLHKNYATYKLFIQQQQYHVSYCNASAIKKNEKLIGGNSDAFQLIVATNKVCPLEGIVCLKNQYDLSQIDAWKKQSDEVYDYYSNNVISEWKAITKIADKLLEDNVKLVEIKIKANTILYTFDFSENGLLLGLFNVKFHKTTWKDLCKQYTGLRVQVKNILSVIHTQQ